MKFKVEHFGTEIQLFYKKNFSLGPFPRVPIPMTPNLYCTQETEKWLHPYEIQSSIF